MSRFNSRQQERAFVERLEAVPLVSPSLFPLPAVPPPFHSKSSSARARQRYHFQQCATGLANATITTLNRLYCPSLSINIREVCLSATPVSSLSVPSVPSAAQLRVQARISSCCRGLVHFANDSRRAQILSSDVEVGETSPVDPLNAVDGLVSVLHSSRSSVSFILFRFLSRVLSPTSTLFSSRLPSPVAPSEAVVHPMMVPLMSSYCGDDPHTPLTPLVAKKVSLPTRLSRLPVTSLLPAHIADLYASPNEALLVAPFQAAVDGGAENVPGASTTRFRGERKEYLPLLTRMHQLNMIAFTSTPLAVNGLFGVPKDGNEIRLIIDATPANQLFHPSPHVSLPNPSSLARLSSKPNRRLWLAKADLESFYHQLLLPEWLCPYFALPGLRASTLVEAGLVDSKRFPCASVMVYPMCTSLPMGWIHSVFVGESVHEHVLYTKARLHPQDNVLHLTSPLVDRTLHCVCLDDIGFLSNSQSECQHQLDRALSAYAEVGLLLTRSKLRPPSDSMGLLGMLIDGRRLLIHLSEPKMRRLVNITLAVLASAEVTGTQLHRVVGLWTWQLMLARPALSVLHYCYRYIEIRKHKSEVLWNSVKQELVMLLSLLPLLRVSLADGWYPLLVATDASEQAAGVVATQLSNSLFHLLWPLTASRHTLHTQIQGLVKYRSSEFTPSIPSNTVATVLQPAMQLTALDSMQREREASHVYMQLVGSPSLQWRTWISSPWRWSEHINTLELQSIILALRRLLSSPMAINHRLLLLCDSAVVAYSITKGRSSAASLAAGMKKVAALTLAGGIRVGVAWIPTQINPADRPSRRPTPSRHKPNHWIPPSPSAFDESSL